MQTSNPILNLPLSTESIPLITDDVKITAQGEVFHGKAEVRLYFSPDLRVRIKVIDLSPDYLVLANYSSVQIEFSSWQEPVKVRLTRLQMGADNFVEATLLGTVFAGKRGSVSQVALLLTNFLKFESDRVFPWQGHKYQTLLLETDKWNIWIYQPRDIKDRLDHLRSTGGFAPTHSGMIERKDQKTIAIKGIDKLFEGLYCFLSFVRGFFCSPLYPRGITKSGREVWWKWSTPYVDRYQSVLSWFDPLYQQAQTLEAIFPGFWRKWTDDVWALTLPAVIYWYCHSNTARSGVDGGVILAQSALERLAWTYVVKSKQALSPEGFERLPAVEQIRLLISQFSISPKVPAELSNLAAAAREFNLDGPEAITEARNKIVHPDRKSDSKRSKALVDSCADSWRLSLWYVDLVLLSLFDYSGEYKNRWNDRIERVPWAN